MNPEKYTPATPGTPEWRSDAPCDSCGRFGAFALGGRWLCSDCYAASGSCCPEFGAFDAATCAVEASAPRDDARSRKPDS
ncbi:MAG: hypothetical protein RMK20_03750 [Verrucomicrobiales bacterium]|nr:hypothetical protein [Verrucomicrobiales bacterium]